MLAEANTYNEYINKIIAKGYERGCYDDDFNSEIDAYTGCPQYAEWQEEWN